MAMHLQEHWQPVAGQRIEIRRDGHLLREGLVGAISSDDQIIWVEGEGNEPRQLFEKYHGYEVWIRYKWESA